MVVFGGGIKKEKNKNLVVWLSMAMRSHEKLSGAIRSYHDNVLGFGWVFSHNLLI